MARSRPAADRVDDLADFLALLLQHLQIVAEDLDGQFALHARQGLLDVVLDDLREVEVHAGQLAGASAFIRLIRPSLSTTLPSGPRVDPLLAGRQVDGDLDVVEALGVGAVVGPAELGIDGLGLGEALEDAADAPLVVLGLLGRDRQRQVRR